MKRNIFIAGIITIVVVVILLAAYYGHARKSPAIPIEWTSNPQIEIYRMSSQLEQSAWDSETISRCKKLLLRAQVVQHKADIELVQVLCSKDKKSVIYVFRDRSISGPRYLFREDITTKQLLEKYWLPDA